MNGLGDKVANIFAGLITVAIVVEVLKRGSETGAIIRAVGDTFATSVRAAKA